MKRTLLLAALLSAGAHAQVNVMNIPALPPGATAPKPVSPPAPATTTPTTTAPATPAPGTSTMPAPSPAATDRPTVTTLPTGQTALATPYTVALSGPKTVKAGEANTWSFGLTNRGQAKIHLEHGACDVRFEVLNAAGEVVRPDPKNSICTLQLVILDVQPGETQEVQKIRWEGKDGAGQPLPAGVYTLRAKMVAGGVYTTPATFQVTVQ